MSDQSKPVQEAEPDWPKIRTLQLALRILGGISDELAADCDLYIRHWYWPPSWAIFDRFRGR